jgi:hypothetical protein
MIDRARWPTAEPISDVDRAEALEIIRARELGLCWTAARRSITPERARELCENHLRTNRVGTWRHDEPGEPKLSTVREGLLVRVEVRNGRARVGLITWQELVGELIDDPPTPTSPSEV